MNHSKEMSRNAEIMQLTKSVDLATLQTMYSAVLRLPTGGVVTVAADGREWDKLAELYFNPRKAEELDHTSAPAPQSSGPPEDQPLSDDERQALERLVEWEQLPDDVLPLMLKRAMHFYQLPATLPLGVVYEKATELAEKLTPEDWKQLEKMGDAVADPDSAFEEALQEPAEPLRMQQPAPQPGAVTWSDGSPIMPSSRAGGRRVSVDEKGNPLLNDKDIDPGEIAGGGDDVDEDGVSSW